MKQDNTISIPGYKSEVEYCLTFNDYNFISQHNYKYYNHTEITVKGWYNQTMMLACDTIVSVWRAKSIR